MSTLDSDQPIKHANHGLSDAEVKQKRLQYGPNSIADTSVNPVRNALGKFWAPVPWMLEAAIIFQLALGDYAESAIVAALLIFNAALGFHQEANAQKTLAALRSRLAMTVKALRNQVWTAIPTSELVPGDIVKLSLGEVIAADMQIIEGSMQVDVSVLTGESMPAEVAAGDTIYAGALVQRGEAVAKVITTGTHTKFGRTAELVQSAHSISSQQTTVMHVVRNLVMFNGVVIVLMVLYASYHHMGSIDIIHLVLTSILASIPVALPATFTLAAAIGAKQLAGLGVLPTRLSAVDEAASMEVLCTDKTGTLTCNELTVNTVIAATGFSEAQVLNFAKLASSDGGKDPVDSAIREAADKNKSADSAKLIEFIPFDPGTKMAQATVVGSDGVTRHIIKGAFAKITGLIQPAPDTSEAHQFEQQGYRVLAVAVGQPGAYQLAGLIVLTDPPRPDSAALITELTGLGITTVMVTGDAFETAKIVAQKIGLSDKHCTPDQITADVHPETYGIFAGVLPEDKFNLVKIFQDQGHTVGMCGDGANDAPALRQAQIGIAVSTATDVAKSAAGVVLTTPGLEGIVNAIKVGRVAFQRILTYALNSITKKIVQILFLVFGLLVTDHAILTPLLMAIIMITGDFLGMSLTTDNVHGSTKPNSWRVGKLSIAGFFMGVGELLYCATVLSVGFYRLHLNLAELQTLAFIAVVFGNQATTYNNRVRGYFWTTRPGNWVLTSSLVDISLASILAIFGVAMTPVPAVLVFACLMAAVAFTFLLDMVKVPLFRTLKIA